MSVSFSVESSARELMLETEDLKEIFEAFFEDAVILMEGAERASRDNDGVGFCKNMHSLKGSALNLRMDVVGELAKQAEKEGAGVSAAQRDVWLNAIKKEIALAKEIVDRFYLR